MVPVGNKAKRFSSVNHTIKQFLIIVEQESSSDEEPLLFKKWKNQEAYSVDINNTQVEMITDSRKTK